MTSLPLPQPPLTSRLNAGTLSRWLAVILGVSIFIACPLILLAVKSAMEGPVTEYPNATMLFPKVSVFTGNVPPCPALHIRLFSNSITNDSPDQVMTWYRTQRMAYAAQSGSPRLMVRYSKGPFRLEYERTPAVYILKTQTQIAIATSLDLRWCP